MKYDDQKLSRSFVTEVGIAANDLRVAFEDKLHKKFGLITQKKPGSKDFHDSIAGKTSIFKALLRGEPPHVNWSVEELSPSSSKIYISFVLPRSLKMSIFLLIGILGLALHSSSFLPAIFPNNIQQGFGQSALPILLLFVLCVSIFALFLLASQIMLLHFRYKKAIDGLLTEISRNVNEEKVVINTKWEGKLFCDIISWDIVLFILIVSFTVMFGNNNNDPELFFDTIIPLAIPLVVFAGLALAIVILEKKGRLYATRFMILCCNGAIAISIISILLSYPMSFWFCDKVKDFQNWPSRQISTYKQSFENDHNGIRNTKSELIHRLCR